MTRITTDEQLMRVAHVVAERSTCSRLHVGAVLAREGRVIATGYNGAPAGMPHCHHRDDVPCLESVHAEINTVIFAARFGVEARGATLYTTHAPCEYCAACLVNLGLAECLYAQPFRSPVGLGLLARAGVKVRCWLPQGASAGSRHAAPPTVPLRVIPGEVVSE